MIADDAAAARDEREEAGANLRRVEDVADSVVQIDSVVSCRLAGRAPGSLESVAVNAPVLSPINCVGRLAYGIEPWPP